MNNYEIYTESNQSGIILDGFKVTDIINTDRFSWCICSKCNDRNRYDKESKTIICEHYNNCLRSVLNKLNHEPGKIADLKAHLDLEMRGI